MDALAKAAARVVTDEHDRTAAEASEALGDRGVARERSIAAQLDEVVADPLNVVEGVRTVRVPSELDRAPHLLGARLCGDALDLPLETRQLPGDADTAEEREAPELREVLTQTKLLDLPLLRLGGHASGEQGEDAPEVGSEIRAADDRV